MKTQFVKGKFVDFEGKERQFVIAAVTEGVELLPVTQDALIDALEILQDDDDDCVCCSLKKALYGHRVMTKAVYFGVSICTPPDEYSIDRGEQIAVGKATCSRTRIGELTATSGMLLTTDHIQLCLNRFAETLVKCPAKFSEAYAKAELKYKSKKLAEATQAN